MEGQELIEEGVRGVGILVLKLVTLGRYRADRHSRVAEGGIGLLVIAAGIWLSYRFFT